MPKINRWYETEFEIRSGEGEKTESRIVGRPIVFDKKTDLGYCFEVIERGALDKADLKDVFLFVNHDINKIPLARSRNNNGNSTMTLSVDDKGMSIDAVLDTTRNNEANALYSAVERGDMSGMSFMFSIDGYRYDDLKSDKPTRIITKISKVFEVSPVNFPAYRQTTLDARNNSPATLDSEVELRSSLDSERAALDSAENMRQLELEKLKLSLKLK